MSRELLALWSSVAGFVELREALASWLAAVGGEGWALRRGVIAEGSCEEIEFVIARAMINLHCLHTHGYYKAKAHEALFPAFEKFLNEQDGRPAHAALVKAFLSVRTLINSPGFDPHDIPL